MKCLIVFCYSFIIKKDYKFEINSGAFDAVFSIFDITGPKFDDVFSIFDITGPKSADCTEFFCFLINLIGSYFVNLGNPNKTVSTIPMKKRDKNNSLLFLTILRMLILVNFIISNIFKYFFFTKIMSTSNCSICLEAISNTENDNIITLPLCNHKFHRTCFTRWRENNNTCPNCRQSFVFDNRETNNTSTRRVMNIMLSLSNIEYTFVFVFGENRIETHWTGIDRIVDIFEYLGHTLYSNDIILIFHNQEQSNIQTIFKMNEPHNYLIQTLSDFNLPRNCEVTVLYT